MFGNQREFFGETGDATARNYTARSADGETPSFLHGSRNPDAGTAILRTRRCRPRFRHPRASL